MIMPVVVSAEALSILVFEKEQPLTLVRFDVIDVACSYYPTFNGTLSAPWFFGKPVPSDRLPCW
jgi:hypothetical protein